MRYEIAHEIGEMFILKEVNIFEV